jgi:hypothetical protein
LALKKAAAISLTASNEILQTYKNDNASKRERRNAYDRKTNPLLRGRSRKWIELYYQYFTNVTKVDAIPAAIDFLMNQEEMGGVVGGDHLALIREQAQIHRNYHHLQAVKVPLPLCHVTYDTLFDDSAYDYRGEREVTCPSMHFINACVLLLIGGNAQPLYDYNSCPFVYPSYHVLPNCQKSEESQNIAPMYKWKWMLRAAQLGKCRMPSVTPLEAAAEYLEQKRTKLKDTESSVRPITRGVNKFNDEPGTAVNVLWLGLSFMGQQFLSSLCQNYGDLGNGPSLRKGRVTVGKLIPNGKKKNQRKQKQDVKLAAGTRDHDMQDLTAKTSAGRCTPNNRLDIKPGFERLGAVWPDRHCTPKSVEYSKNNITVRYCYQYVFNLRANAHKMYRELPCGYDWSDVDVIFGILPMKEFSDYYIHSTGGSTRDLRHVTYISVQAVINHVRVSINSAYAAHNFTQLKAAHTRGKPTSCADANAGMWWLLTSVN